MGDFCLSGFHSRVPIKGRDKVIAIICAKNENELSYVPCYAESPLIPMHIPVVGTMGDYGILDTYEEDVTTRFLKRRLGNEFISISEMIRDYRCHNPIWNKEHGITELFNKLNELPSDYYRLEATYTIIYEHYDIYKAMTHDIPKMRETFSEIPLTGNIFNPYILENLRMKTFREHKSKEEFNALIEKHKGLLIPGRYLNNYIGSLPGLNYFYMDCDIDWSNNLDKIIGWCSFISTLESMNGEFTYSMHAGQTWQYNKEYVHKHQELHSLIIELYNRLLSEEDNE